MTSLLLVPVLVPLLIGGGALLMERVERLLHTPGPAAVARAAADPSRSPVGPRPTPTLPPTPAPRFRPARRPRRLVAVEG